MELRQRIVPRDPQDHLEPQERVETTDKTEKMEKMEMRIRPDPPVPLASASNARPEDLDRVGL